MSLWPCSRGCVGWIQPAPAAWRPSPLPDPPRVWLNPFSTGQRQDLSLIEGARNITDGKSHEDPEQQTQAAGRCEEKPRCWLYLQKTWKSCCTDAQIIKQPVVARSQHGNPPMAKVVRKGGLTKRAGSGLRGHLDFLDICPQNQNLPALLLYVFHLFFLTFTGATVDHPFSGKS